MYFLIGRLLNDSDINPNCKLQVCVDHQDQLKALFIALKDIPEDKELRYNYGGGPYEWRNPVSAYIDLNLEVT